MKRFEGQYVYFALKCIDACVYVYWGRGVGLVSVVVSGG